MTTHPCTTCGTPVVPGADGHDQGLDDMGAEVFACADCCRECAPVRLTVFRDDAALWVVPVAERGAPDP